MPLLIAAFIRALNLECSNHAYLLKNKNLISKLKSERLLPNEVIIKKSVWHGKICGQNDIYDFYLGALTVNYF